MAGISITVRDNGPYLVRGGATVTDAEGKAHVEQVFKTELEALRGNKHNTDSSRNVRFLPYGLDVSLLDGSGEEAE